MKREIKFRALNDARTRWVYGSLMNGYEWADFIIEDAGFEHRVRVDSETVGQYTGLKDKNGTEIYEGDKMSCDGKIKVVIYNQKQCCFELIFEKGGGFKDYIEYFTDRGGVVIGNIHESKTT